ncbi:transposase, IS605 OrfB family [Crinalium epipsammum PCC 9333]|uniref:Transposase, IS605 OrfB family n=1 Tax=Crinalium epipsammum PCC 9333 TaxID=1173022 RepID=K9VYA5_9CYAN|nr:RNA-guided endonuclease TnpB family protein [Crinalium epipsammum]AFZ12956.1 transposase, IS605 OrfB family [Crinalium epipsammum PCC 9333]
MFGCQQVRINPSKEVNAVLEYLCGESNKLNNCAIYYARQVYFKTGKIVNKFALINELKQNSHYGAMHSQAAQQTIISVAESFSSFIGLLKGINNGAVIQKPKMPNYKKKGGLAVVAYPSQAVKFKAEGLRFPLGTKVKAWFGIGAFYLPMPSNLDYKNIREYRILPRNGEFYLELVYKAETVKAEVDNSSSLGIDHGIDNWLTCVSNTGTSFIVDGKHLKSLNQWYNKRVSILKENQPEAFWSKQLARVTEKRNRQVRDAINKAAKLIITHCLENQIGTVVFGWNKGQKDSANLGSKTNQKFVQIPTGRLKERIKQLCEQYGIKFVETEESYTSKASFLDSDQLPKFGEKPKGWKETGKRVKRGLYRTASNHYINADANGSANILRKVATTLGFDLGGVCRGALTTPLRFRLWTLKESHCL